MTPSQALRHARPVPIVALVSLVCLAVGAAGCQSHPVRQAVLGEHCLATREFAVRAPTPLQPAGAVAGLATDVGLAAADATLWVAGIPVMAGYAGYTTWAESLDGAWWAVPAIPVLTALGLIVTPFYQLREGNFLDLGLPDEGVYGRCKGLLSPAPDDGPDAAAPEAPSE